MYPPLRDSSIYSERSTISSVTRGLCTTGSVLNKCKSAMEKERDQTSIFGSQGT